MHGRILPIARAAALMGVLGCTSLAQLPDSLLDARAPASAERPWTPSPEMRERYAMSDPDRAPRGLPADAPSSSGGTYDLPTLIDLALAENPTTRAAWEAARASEGGLGRAKAEDYPHLRLSAYGGINNFPFPIPNQTYEIRNRLVLPQAEVAYTLFDFGRRSATAEQAKEQLIAADFAFNRNIQQVVFGVQQAFYALGAARSSVEAAGKNLELAHTNRELAEERLKVGLATEPAVLLARQLQAESEYDLESAKSAVETARSALATVVGIRADIPLEVETLEHLPLPAALPDRVDELVETAVSQRPDLAAKVASLRAHEAALAKAKAAWFPQVSFLGELGQAFWSYDVAGFPRQNSSNNDYTALLIFRWDLFTGFERHYAIRQAQAEVEVSRAELRVAELGTIDAVWRSYYEFRSAHERHRYAEALLKASEESYAANLETYREGLSTISDLLTADRDLARARYTLIRAKTDYLDAAAAVDYAVGATRTP
ncbi:MAG TPA: TolC family protein [Deltaproteobacteria bacterium]|nr:TolC family protein [Deltaproteobacteria bacterium]